MQQKILLLYTSHRQLREVYLQSLLYRKFPEKYSNIICNVDVLFYCNSTQVPKDKLIKYLNLLPQKNKKLIYTSKNIGYCWGGHESLSETFDVWKDYDIVIHLHPDVFILSDNVLCKIIEEIKTDFVNSYNLDPKIDDNRNYLAFDFFMFRPKQIFNKTGKEYNFFNLYLDENERIKTKTPEHLLSRVINKYTLTSSIVQRYHNHHWEPRRTDMINLYHRT